MQYERLRAAVVCHAGARLNEKGLRVGEGGGFLSLSTVLKYSNAHSFFFPPRC